MPTDPPHIAAASADVAIAASGALTTMRYTWSHPDDGAQDGLLVIGAHEEPGGLVAFWCDSWHQSPEPKVLVGRIDDGLLIMSYTYGGDWQWQITVNVTNPDVLVLRMDNIVPESAAGPEIVAGAYPAMLSELRRGCF